MGVTEVPHRQAVPMSKGGSGAYIDDRTVVCSQALQEGRQTSARAPPSVSVMAFSIDSLRCYMSKISSNSPRSISTIDAKLIKVPSVSSSSEAQERSPVSQQPANSVDERLLDAMWRSPDLFHQIGILDRQYNRFKNLPVDGATDAVAQAQKLSRAPVD
jgi:hypothetical protein